MLALAALGACTVAGTRVARAAEPAGYPSDPQLRVETGMHTGFIKKLSASADGRRLLTVSDDKTARVWDAADGRLLQTLRVPIAPGTEGQLFAGVLTPDGRHALVGGFTGFEVKNGAVLYVFDAQSGQLVGGIDRLPAHSIENLAFSVDGGVLAICQSDGGGVSVYDWRAKRFLVHDQSPRAKILGAAFAPNGDLALTSEDGVLWLYEASRQYQTPRHVELRAAASPMHVQYSADGRHLAVGFDAAPVIAILDAATLQDERVLRLPDALRQRGLHVVEWVGQSLVAGGEPLAGGTSRLWRLSTTDAAEPMAVLAAQGRVSDARRLPGGAFAWSSGDPALGVVNADGSVRWRHRADTLDVSAATKLAVDERGTVVRFNVPTGTLKFDLSAAPDRALTREVAPPRADARAADPAWRVRSQDDGAVFSVNDAAVALEPGERVRAWRVNARDASLVAVTAWSLRAVDARGRQRWRVDTPDNARAIALSGDGSIVVCSFADGTLRWYRAADGRELLALMVTRDASEWVAWLPSGYYESSVSGDALVGWQLNNGGQQTPDFFRAVQFERVLYRPDLVRTALRAGAAGQGATRAGADATLDIRDLRRIAPPRLQVDVLDAGSSPATGTVRLKVTGQSLGLPMNELTVFVDGIPVLPAADRVLAASERQAFARELTVPVFSARSDVRVEVFNGTSLGIGTSRAEGAVAASRRRGTLYVAALGVNRFEDARVPELNYASPDATGLAQALGADRHGFDRVKTFLRADGAPDGRATRAALPDLVRFLKQAQAEDTVVLFLASHGISDPAGNYYFLPADARFDDIRAALEGGTPGESLIGWKAFFDALHDTAGRRILIVDTCSSGNMAGTFDAHSLAKRSMASNFALLAASRGDEESQETPQVGHGIFTYGLIEGLGSASRKSGALTLRELFTAATRTVERLRDRRKAQTPQFTAPDVLQQTALRRTP